MNEAGLKTALSKAKTQILKLSKRTRAVICIAVGSAVLLAVILAVSLNNRNSGYTVLYPGMSAAESGTVYQTLIELGAKPEINKAGEVMVPENEYDIWILQLAAKGLPKTAMTYDVFSSHTGLTATESEKKQWLLYQLQDRMQETLKRISGVESATITITLPEKPDTVWESVQDSTPATASVLLTLGNNVELRGEQVSAIKNLVSSGVPQMLPENVTVVDSETAMELKDESNSDGITSSENLNYEQTVQRQLEENIVRILSPRYGAAGVVAVAKVTIDYDKMMSERMELIEKPDNGGGYTTSDEERYSLNGEAAAGDVVGEENNTDIPQYAYSAGTDENGMTYYWRSRDYDYGYIKTQIEHGNARLEHATVSVMVNEKDLTQPLRDELTSLISSSVDIAAESIVVSSFTPAENKAEIPEKAETEESGFPLWAWFVIAGAALLVIIAVVVIVIVRKKKKAKAMGVDLPDEKSDDEIQSEIDFYKKQLEDKAKSGLDVKDEAVMRDVRDFAKENPEVTANLLASWLKESS